MPRFEYVCESCQIKFEAIKPIAERATAECPQCEQPAGKVMSVANHTFGFKLADESHERFGPRDKMVRDI